MSEREQPELVEQPGLSGQGGGCGIVASVAGTPFISQKRAAFQSLVAKLRCLRDLLRAELDVAALRRRARKREAQRVGAVLVDQVERDR